MNYHVSDIEDQIVETLKNNDDLKGVDNISTHAGQINIRMFLGDPTYYEGIISLLPFIFVRYAGRMVTDRDSVGRTNKHKVMFELYVAAQSLRTKQESQRDCYTMLESVYDSLHGVWPNWSGMRIDSALPRLDGDVITVTDFNANTPLLEEKGESEKLLIEMPTIAVYSTRYYLEVWT